MFCSPRIRRPHAAPRITYDVPTLCAGYKFPKVAVTRDATIGIIELGGGYKPADIAAAFAKWGLPAPKITDVSVAGGTNAPGNDADAEVVLDIEVSAAVYAYCTGRAAVVRVYFAPNSDAGFAAAVAQAAADGCAVLSISWGGPEDSWGSAIVAFSQACAAAVSKGCTIFAASGDNDSSDGERGNHVDYPASDPNVIGCGGTSRTTTTEVVWNDGTNGTGGGYSASFPVQSWQVGAPTGGGRMVPDVSANADPQTGYNVYLNGLWTVIGGTSAVAPLYAGLFAALSPQLSLPRPVVQALWSAPKAFRDIVSGNNSKFKAGVGPDPCTGLGVVDGSQILAALGASAPPTPVPPPPVPVPPPPIPVPPPAKLGQIVIDLDAKTVTLPSGFAVGSATAKGNVNWLPVVLDLGKTLLDVRAGNWSAVEGDVVKVLGDIGVTVPPILLG